MILKYFKLLTLCAFFIIPLFSCYKLPEVNNCSSFRVAPITKIVGSNTALVNQEVDLTISFGCTNGCGQFGNFEETTSGNTSTIKINAKYEGCICTKDAPTRTISYKFKKMQPGTYELKFYQSDNLYVTHTITVQ